MRRFLFCIILTTSCLCALAFKNIRHSLSTVNYQLSILKVPDTQQRNSQRHSGGDTQQNKRGK